MRALVSVSDRSGIVSFCSSLVALGWEIVASGGTASLLSSSGVAVTPVEKVTGVGSMLDGRVKTLHPALHAGILFDRSRPEHAAELEAAGIEPIDLVVSNFYPFASQPGIELIDVGGPTMVRAAAKSWSAVAVLVDPADYSAVLEELSGTGALSEETRQRLAAKAFSFTSSYDSAIASWMAGLAASSGVDSAGSAGAGLAASPGAADAAGAAADEALPEVLSLTLVRSNVLRYGENPHQRAARYRFAPGAGWWEGAVVEGGKELSYSNVVDAEAAWQLAWELTDTGIAAVVVKHANPCGVAVASDAASACRQALACDPLSAFGGIIACSAELDLEEAQALVAGPQADVVVAPRFSEAARAALVARRKATRLITAPRPTRPRREIRAIDGGLVVEEPDLLAEGRSGWRLATDLTPSTQAWRDLELAWRVRARASSNAVVVVAGEMAVGVGAGQPARVDAARLAVQRAGDRARGAVAASDAFFPFRDGLDVLADAGISAVVAPGGSMRDPEVTAAAEERGVALVLAEHRHFRH